MTEQQDSTRGKLSQRGFILIVVLLGVFVISLAVLIQLDTASNTRRTSLRQKETTKARGYAEHCLNLAEAIARDYLDNSGELDFDCLLEGGGTCGGPVDDRFMPKAAHVPGAGAVAFIPRSAATAPQPRRQLHQFRYVSIGDGGCYLRFDDNSDDAITAPSLSFTTNNTNAGDGEGAGATATPTGVEVLHRDRDRSMFVTAVGIYPQLGALADHYDQAHARVTLRRMFGAAPLTAAPAGFGAIAAGGNVTIKKKADICGNGSITTADPNTVDLGSDVCMCGDVSNCDASSDCPPDGCSPSECSTCNDNNPQEIGGVAAPVVDIPNPSFQPLSLSADAFNSKVCRTSPAEIPTPCAPDLNTIGTNNACEFWARPNNGGEIFYWDHENTDTVGGDDPLSADNCQTYAKDPIEPPCDWALTDANTIACAANQTACWRLATRFPNGTDFTLGAGGSTSTITPGGGWAVDNNARENGATATSWNAFCGNNAAFGNPIPNACSQCTGSVVAPTHDLISFNNGGAPANNFSLQDGNIDNRHFPVPAYVYIQNTADLEIDADPGADWTNGPLQITWITNQGIEVNDEPSFCGAECDCSTLTNENTFACDASETQMPPIAQHCPVFRSDGHCDMVDLQSGLVFGTIQCESIEYNNNACVVGDLVATGPGVACSECEDIGSGTAGICFKNNAEIFGEMSSEGNICTKNNYDGVGMIVTGGSFDAKNNFNLVGGIVAEGQVDLGSNITIDATSTSTAPIPAFGGLILSTFLETPW